MFSFLTSSSLFDILSLCFSKSHYLSNFGIFFVHLLIHVRGQIMTIKSSRGDFVWERALFTSNSLFRATKKILSIGHGRFPYGHNLLNAWTANQIPGNPGTTVVCIGHGTFWLENHGYRTQVWDNVRSFPISFYREAAVTVTRQGSPYLSQLPFVLITEAIFGNISMLEHRISVGYFIRHCTDIVLQINVL